MAVLIFYVLFFCRCSENFMVPTVTCCVIPSTHLGKTLLPSQFTHHVFNKYCIKLIISDEDNMVFLIRLVMLLLTEFISQQRFVSDQLKQYIWIEILKDLMYGICYQVSWSFEFYYHHYLMFRMTAFALGGSICRTSATSVGCYGFTAGS